MIKRMAHQEVEVQITPMLDMAFQLLTFFILTYRPAPTEGQFSMDLLPAAPAVDFSKSESATTKTEVTADVPALLRTLTTRVRATPQGTIASLSIGENRYETLEELGAAVKAFKADPNLPFDQAVIDFDPGLRYESMIRVIDVFSSAGISKISFNEPGASAAEPSL